MERVRITERERLTPRKTERVRLEDEILTPDYAARKVIVAAFCYYVLDDPIMDDATYDKLSVYVAKNFDKLHPDRQWCLRNPDDTRAGGSHIRYSLLAASAALNHVKYKNGKRWIIDQQSLRKRKADGMYFVTGSCNVWRDRS
jgi:hypothetical protein